MFQKVFAQISYSPKLHELLLAPVWLHPLYAILSLFSRKCLGWGKR